MQIYLLNIQLSQRSDSIWHCYLVAIVHHCLGCLLPLIEAKITLCDFGMSIVFVKSCSPVYTLEALKALLVISVCVVG